MLPNVVAMKRYLERHLETVRRQGGEGLIAEIVRVEKDGGQISRNEIVSMVFLRKRPASRRSTGCRCGLPEKHARRPVVGHG